jgi:protein SCO1/2
MPDIEVFDQNGRKLHFYTDLIKGKTVVLNFIYTSCTATCPMMGRSFSRLQAELGDRLGKDVYLISISMDPETDTPERLKAWGEQFGAKPGWILVTGEKASMDTLLRFMRGDPARKGDHTAAVLIGNYDKGMWIREFGLAEPHRYTRILKDVLNKTKADQK